MWALCLSLAVTGCGGGGTPAPASYTVSGVITAALNSAVDGDVNDPLAPYKTNSSIDAPQPIPNPVVLGGYVNVASCGTNGRSKLTGDARDYFLVSLQAGQTVTLVTAQFGSGTLPCGNNNLALSLYRQSDTTTPVQSVSGAASLSIPVPAADNYIVDVQALQGASNYILTTGLNTAAAAPEPSLADDFVPGEVLVTFKARHASATGVTGVEVQADALGMDVVSGQGDGPVLLRLRAGARSLQALGVEQRPIAADPTLQSRLDTLAAVRALRARADIASADPNYIRKALLTPNDSDFAQQWDERLINMPQAWDLTTGSSQVIVAVLDTGILPGHPDLQGKLVTGYDFISDPQNALDGDGIDPDPTDPGDQSLGGSSSFHGSHVAGTVAAATNNGTGIAGTGWQTRVMPLRILGKIGGTSSDICNALRYAAGLQNDSNTLPAQRADIVNMSFGGVGFSQTEQSCVNSARNNGVILIAAAGNNASPTPEYPAAYDGVVSVSAVNLSRQLASYSNYGAAVDVAAPGGEIGVDVNGDGNPDGVLSTVGDDASGTLVYTYRYYAGTSMAVPHVAGVAALMKAVDPGLDPLQFDAMLSGGQLTDDLGVPGRDDQYGYGLINAYKAVAAAQAAASGTGQALAPLLTVSPAALNLGLTQVSATLSVSNGGEGTLTVAAPTQDSGGWLTLKPVVVDANGVGGYAVVVDRGGLSPGTYTASVNFTSNGGDMSVPVIMQVPDVTTDLTANAGYQYVLLVNPQTGDTVATVGAAVAAGVYHFTFSNVPPGTYQIVAGTDMNNDGYICDAGEACGAYTTLDLPDSITVTGDQSGRNFTTGFFYNINAAAAGGRSGARAYRHLSVVPAGNGP